MIRALRNYINRILKQRALNRKKTLQLDLENLGMLFRSSYPQDDGTVLPKRTTLGTQKRIYNTTTHEEI